MNHLNREAVVGVFSSGSLGIPPYVVPLSNDFVAPNVQDFPVPQNGSHVLIPDFFNHSNATTDHSYTVAGSQSASCLRRVLFVFYD